jgi:hypothetical protein
MRTAPTIALLIALAAPAHAAMMVNYDLAGLVLESQEIVVADRVAGKPSHYTVVRAIRGKLGAGATFDLDDQLYDLDGTDARVTVFLTKSQNGSWYPTSAGLRVVKDGKVFRFEQWQNPGGFTRVPQGHDPEDNWRASPQIDQGEFDRELAAAIARVDALPAPLALTDPAKRREALFALLPPLGSSHGGGGGFYTDVLTREVSGALGKRGDLEGALAATLHDHSGVDNWFGEPGSVAELIAVAKDSTKSIAIRRAAIASVADHHDYFANTTGVTAIVALLADPVPAIRAAAVLTVAHTWGWQSSDAKEDARRKQIQRDTRAALAKLFVSEPDNLVLAALASVYENLPPRRGGPAAVARVSVRGGILVVQVDCLHRDNLTTGKLLATGKGGTVDVPNAQIMVACNGMASGGGGTPGKDLAPGTYQLSIGVKVAGKPTTIGLESVSVAPNGELTLE